MNQEGKKIRYQFLSVLSHELKAPLNALEGYLRMMQGKQAGELVDDYATPIERFSSEDTGDEKSYHGPSGFYKNTS